ncbi:hypothetical protein ABT224_26670 [Streptomyces sp. NPDC001584]|uniref:hypothetical protein n=1 Tax=Streptomyces sp. NPDC001584 TaxID=3154521 RepID=UPI003334845F
MTSTSPKSPKPPKSPLTTVTGALCFVLVVGGASGLLHEWLGWIHFMGFVRFLAPDGYEIYSYIVMIALGLAVGAAGDVLTRRGQG